MKKEIFNLIVKERNNYNLMIDYCCEKRLILNNNIINYDYDNWEVFTGSIYDEEEDTYYDIYQYYIITDYSASRLAELTNETVVYNSNLDIYLLCVMHYGTYWGGVSANWKNVEEMEDQDNE